MNKDNFLIGIDVVANWWTNSFLKKYPKDKQECFKRSLIENFNSYFNNCEFFRDTVNIWIQSDRFKPSMILVNAICASGLSLYDFPSKASSVITEDGTVIVYNPEVPPDTPIKNIIFKPKEKTN